MTALGNVHVDRCDNLVEVTAMVPGDVAGLPVLLSPAQWCELVDQAEQLEPVKELRRQRSIEAAREAASHHARASRR